MRVNALFLLAFVYPPLVYFGIHHLPPVVFGLLIGLTLLPRLRLALLEPALMTPAVLLVGYAVAVSLTGAELLLRLYPAVINLILLVVFSATLWRPPPMIERIADAAGTPVSAQGKRYVFRLTQVWCGFFLFNGCMALLTAFAAPLSVWALYNGLISYVLLGLLMGGERLYRQRYQARVHAGGE